jgi:hypothetical protein
LGLQNKQWGADKIDQLVSVGKRITKTDLVYVNFSVETHSSRLDAMTVLKDLEYVTIEKSVDYLTYLKNLARHKFCICPRGNGIDTHRFWEAQYLDSIPVILLRDWIPAYSELPILILENWAQLKELDLNKIYIYSSNKNYIRSGLNLHYLSGQIQDD